MKLSTPSNYPVKDMINQASNGYLRTSTTMSTTTTDSDSKGSKTSDSSPKIANFDNIKGDIENAGGSTIDDCSVHGEDDPAGESTSNGEHDSTSKDGTSSGTTSVGGGKSDTSSSKFSLANKESADIMKLRALVISLMLACAVGVSAVVYTMSKKSEVSEYNDQYDAAAKVVLDNFLNIMDAKMGVVSTLGVALIAQAVHSTTENFPFVTLSNFHERAATAVKQSGTILLHTSPVVTSEEREAWETYSAGEASGWVQEGLDYQSDIGMFDFRNSDTFSQDGLANFTEDQSRPIWRYNFDGDRLAELDAGPYMPVWQTTPVIYGGANVNQNLFKNDIDKLGARLCVETGSFVMGSMLTPPPPGFEDEAYVEDDVVRVDYIDHEMATLISTLLGIVKRQKVQYEGGPIGHVYLPIFDDFTKDRKPVAVMTAWIHWMDYFKKILPPVMEGIDIVLTNTCDEASFTMRINGPDVVAVGRGDFHERAYDHMKRSSSFETVENIPDGTKFGLPFNKNHCMVQLDVYSSDTFYHIYNTSIPVAVTCAVAAVFMVSVFLFFVYDHLVQSRQNMVMARAHKTQKMVTSLFPEDVAERMMDQAAKEREMKKKGKDGVFSNANKAFSGVLSEDELREKADDTPIADLFPFCTVLFADIAGFTAWSSAREPAQVFILLQAIYEAFDKIAKRRKVFKVETIGDSYVAVTGLPDPQKNHAVIMSRFAGECRYVMKELVNKLEPRLGPDTADLSMRFGLHSGPVTAGVLRGAKARFQLFGDTVNVSSRMESTGLAGRIQVSESTYNLLKKAGKDKWLQPRLDGVKAKGKGVLKSWWVNPHSKHASSTGGSSVTGSTADITADLITPTGLMSPTAALAEKAAKRATDLSAQDKRLVAWVVDLLHENIQKVVALRNSTSKTSATPKAVMDVEYEKPAEGKMSMDELTNVLHTPEFCQSAFDGQEDYRSIRLGENAMSQLYEMVSGIARLYNRNPFHNFEHACHVTMSVSKFIKRITSPGLAKLDDDLDHNFTAGINSDPLTVLGIIFSAVIHDADHRGVSNAQLSTEQPELGDKYHNKSVAEQHSLDMAWGLLMEDRFVDLRGFLFTSDAELQRFRQVLVNVVLATDIFDAELNKTRKGRWDQAFANNHCKGGLAPEEFDALRSTIVIEHIIQASDVSHTMQHWHIYRKWNAKLFREMFTAYQHGRMGKNPADFWYQGELGFFDNYIIPLAKKLKDCQVFGVSSYECLDYAIQNRNEWRERGKELVNDLVMELTNPIPAIGGQLDALVEDEQPAIPSVIGGDKLSNPSVIDPRKTLKMEDESMEDVPLDKSDAYNKNDSELQLPDFTIPVGERINEALNRSSGLPMAA